MRTNVRIGNDIKLVWQILEGGVPVNLTNATDIKVSIAQGGTPSCDKIEITTFEVTDAVNGIIAVEVQKEVITELGYLWTVLEYTVPDSGMIDGNRKVTVDNVPVRIVAVTAEASQDSEFTVSSDIQAGFQGLSAYEVWLKDNPDKTKEDYYNWLQKPATDIAKTVGLQEQARVEAEEQRVLAEELRQTNTATAISNAENATENANTAAQNADDARLAIQDDLALKADQADLVQLAGEVSLFKDESNLKDAIQDSKIKDIESVLSTANLNQSAQLSVSGVSPLSLPKNAANGGMDVKLEGLTEDVGGVITHFEPTGRVRSVDKNGLNPTALYLTAPELRSNGTVKDEIRKGANGYELVKRVGVGIPIDIKSQITLTTGLGIGWSVSGYTLTGVNVTSNSSSSPTGLLKKNRFYRIKYEITDYISGTIQSFLSVDGTSYSAVHSGNGVFERVIISSNTGGALQFGKSPSSGGFDGFTGKITLLELVEYSITDGIVGATSFTQIGSNIHYTLATPEIIPISYGGVLNSAENGTVYHEPVVADAGVYDTKMDILLTDYPIATIEEIIKHENGVDTYLNVATAVIASDGLSFTHPDLADGDLVLFTYAYDKESTNGNITATFYDSNVVKIDTVTGKAYRINEVVTNGVLTRTLTEV